MIGYFSSCDKFLDAQNDVCIAFSSLDLTDRPLRSKYIEQKQVTKLAKEGYKLLADTLEL